MQLGLDVDVSLASVERGVRDLARFVEQSRDITRACLNSGLLFAPARGRANTLDHLQARSRGEYLPLVADRARAIMERLEGVSRLASHTIALRSSELALPSQTFP